MGHCGDIVKIRIEAAGVFVTELWLKKVVVL